jgi:hypothetical protein
MSSGPFTQRWNVDPNHIKPIQQVLPKPSCHRLRTHVAIGRRDDTHVDLAAERFADATDFLLLNGAKELCLGAG